MDKFVRPLPLTDEKDASGKKVPFADTKRINHRDQFELTYLRWRYLMRAGNPPRELLERYRPLTRKLAGQNFRRFSTLYAIMGMAIEDVDSVAQVQLVSYLGVFSVEHHEESAKKFEQESIEKTGQLPSIQEVKDADIKRMASFIGQRLLDFARVCSQKSKSVETGSIVYQMYALDRAEKPCNDSALREDPAKYGFKKIPQHVAAKVRKAAGRKFHGSERFEVDGKVYRLVHETFARVSLDRFADHDNLLVFNPQDAANGVDRNDQLLARARYEKMLERYNGMSGVGKKKFLNRMIKILQARGDSQKELDLANSMLSKLR
jgi:hypothetical protein